MIGEVLRPEIHLFNFDAKILFFKQTIFQKSNPVGISRSASDLAIEDGLLDRYHVQSYCTLN